MEARGDKGATARQRESLSQQNTVRTAVMKNTAPWMPGGGSLVCLWRSGCVLVRYVVEGAKGREGTRRRDVLGRAGLFSPKIKNNEATPKKDDASDGRARACRANAPVLQVRPEGIWR